VGFGATHHRQHASTAPEDFLNKIGYWKGLVEGLEQALERADKALASNEKSLKFVEDLIGNLKVQLLQAKGAMTCRGLLEEAERDIIYENDLSPQMSISDALSNLDGPYPEWLQKKKKVGRRTDALLSAWHRCVKPELSKTPGMYYRELYQELSKEIHGVRWSGPYVKYTFAKEQKEYLCIFEAICVSFDLKLETQVSSRS